MAGQRTMKVILGGVRGTSCIAQSDYMTYGGETTSVLVEGDAGERVILDAGTGIRSLGQRIESGKVPPSILLLITHYQRMLNYIKPDVVHVMMGGKIVQSGGPELALRLEELGYDWVREQVEESASN